MDLFNNPMIDNALKALSPEDVNNYQKIGEYMFGHVDFETSKHYTPNQPPTAEIIGYIEEGLKSGLHPKELNEEELKLLVDTYGEEWYKKYDYTREEVPEPGLSMKAKENLDKIAELTAKKMENEEKQKKKNRNKNNKKK